MVIGIITVPLSAYFSWARYTPISTELHWTIKSRDQGNSITRCMCCVTLLIILQSTIILFRAWTSLHFFRDVGILNILAPAMLYSYNYFIKIFLKYVCIIIHYHGYYNSLVSFPNSFIKHKTLLSGLYMFIK